MKQTKQDDFKLSFLYPQSLTRAKYRSIAKRLHQT